MRVVLTAEAEADLEAIGDYIARDNPHRAVTFVRDLAECCQSLANMPLAFPLVPRHEHSGIRRRLHGAYLIFYHVTEDQVQILHVLHGARDYRTLLFSDR